MQERPTVLLPLQVLEGESIPNGVPELLANAHVVLLGYHVVPDQTATDQARSQFEERAQSRLEESETILTDAGATVERRLVFTHEGQQTIDRVNREHDCLAVLVPNSTTAVENVLVPVRGVVGTDRFVRLLSGLFAPADSEGVSSRVRSALARGKDRSPGTNITLYHLAAEDETDEDVELLLEGIATRLEEAGIESEAIEFVIERDGSPQDAIVDAGDEYDVVVMGESDPSLATFVFGMRAEQVAEQFFGPVFVVQREKPTGDDEEPTETTEQE